MAANYVTDQLGRVLTTVFTDYRGDASIGGPEILETTIDLSIIGSNTTFSNVSSRTTLPNGGLGLAAGDSIDVAVLPYNFQVQAVQFIADTNAPTPDIIPTGVQATGAAGTLTALTYSLGRYLVSTADRATAITVGAGVQGGAFTGSATTYASAANLITASAMNASALVYTAGTDYLPWINTGTGSIVTGTQAGVYVLRLTVGAFTGTATNLKTGKFRFRIAGIAYNI